MAFAVSFSTDPSNTEPACSCVGCIGDALDAIREIEIRDSSHLAEIMAEVEVIKRRAHALAIDLLEASEQTGMHFQDGHRSAKNMTRHVNKLSGGEAAGREKCWLMFRKLPVIADAYRAGRLGTDQVMLLGRVFANPRVRGAMEGRSPNPDPTTRRAPQQDLARRTLSAIPRRAHNPTVQPGAPPEDL